MYESKLARKLQKIFGWTANDSEMVQFGTPTNGRAVYSKDAADIQTPYYEAGWFPESLTGNIRPYAEDMNGLHFVHSYQLAYLLQAGIPEWDPDTPYFTNCIVRGLTSVDAKVGRTLYVSMIDNNSNNPPWLDDTGTRWSLFTLGDTAIPVGASLEWNSNTLPAGGKWLFEDGSYVSKKVYEDLYKVIGDTFGPGQDRTENGETVHYFALPYSTGRVAVGYKSGDPVLKTLGRGGGQMNHQHFVPAHKHGKGNLNIIASGDHNHTMRDPGHVHDIGSHNHHFRFGDYSAAKGTGVSCLANLGSAGLSGTSNDPTTVNWDRGPKSGKEGSGAGQGYGHFYKGTSHVSLSANVNTTGVGSEIAQHVHRNQFFSGVVGAPSGRDGDQPFLTIDSNSGDYSSNMPFIVKRKIIRALP